jgi:hypothetical protein
LDQNLHPLTLEIIGLIQANQLSGKEDLILKAIAVDEALESTIFNIGLSYKQSNRLQDALLIFTYLKVRTADDPTVSYDEYLARYHVCNLFLDTTPYIWNHC